ncbi:MAG: Obg family GTPase, partial [Bacteroidota bacterium]
GGRGNIRFKSSVNQAPSCADPGMPGEEMWVWLRLKLIADVGLLGLPNAGKSTFLSSCTRAKPKIADYPFTTLVPQLGVVYHQDREFVLADIPGLIEGAHEGHGLGDRFLGHVERCSVLLHVIDATQDDVCYAYETIRSELEAYDSRLVERPEVIALNKCDALFDEDIQEKQAALSALTGKQIFCISAVTGLGVKDVLSNLMSYIFPDNHDNWGPLD